MPATKDYSSNKYNHSRTFPSNEISMSARVYHPATNLMPASPPLSPTGTAPTFPNRPNTHTWGRQNSQNGGKYGS